MSIQFRHKTSWKCFLAAAFAAVLTIQPGLAVERVFCVTNSYNGLPGATGNGTTDDTAAIQRAFSAATNAFNSSDTAGYSGVAVVFPAGTYIISDRLKFVTTNFPPQGGGITIRGVDTLRTVIQSTGSTGAFYFKLGGQRTANKFLRLQIEDIKLFADSSPAGPAIEIEPDGTGMTLGIRPMLRNLHINRTTTANSYTYGIKL
ncbi:MAG: glycosyl hydrolase family 28-related protein, partial [Kiritimatiellales bacterium]